MSGICKYPESVCPHMTVLKGKSYCDVTPCQLTGELPKRTNADQIRGMGDEELAKFLKNVIKDAAENLFNCEEYGEKYGCTDCDKCYLEWLKQTVED